MGSCQRRVEFERAVEVRACVRDILQPLPRQMPQTPLVGFPGPQAFRWLAQRAPLFRIRDSRSDGPGDRQRDLVLHCKYVGQITVVTLRPNVVAGLGVDELRGHANPLAAPAHAAFQHVAHAEFAPDLLHVDRIALVGEAGIAGDDEQRTAAGQFGDDVVGDAVREILLLRVAAHVGEGEHGDRWSVRQRQRFGCRYGCGGGSVDGPKHKRLDGSRDVLQVECPKRLEGEIEPVMHMIAHRARDADAAWRALGLEPGRDIHAVAVQVGSVGNRIADVDPHAEADGCDRAGWSSS